MSRRRKIATDAPTFLAGLAMIEEAYDGFIIDQWGVLHDGGATYPGAIETLQMLRARDKRIVLLSNSGKRAAHNAARIALMGLTPDLFDAVVTSGEACWQAIHDRDGAVFSNLGRRCLLWSRDSDLSHAEGLDLELVRDVREADFIYLAGIDDYAPLEPFLPALEIGAKRGLPLICANPDIVALYPDGWRGMAPGGVARRYEELGGTAVYVGKPYRPVYVLAQRELGALNPARILAIGDSLEHDVAGGNAMGFDTALVTSGVHQIEFGAAPHELDQAVLEHLAGEYRATPRYAMTRFRW